MSNLIPRKKIVPVEARRVVIPTTPALTPTPAAVPNPPVPVVQPVSITQQNFYVNVHPVQPQAATPIAAEPTAPREVHHYTTHVYHSPTRPRLSKKASFLGAMGVVLGAIAIGAEYVPQVLWASRPLATVGACIAGLALLNAMLFRRVFTGLPMLGLLVSGIGYGLYLKNTGQLPTELPRIEFNTSVPPVHK